MALDADELRAIVLHLAGQVDSSERRGFLAQLDTVGTTGPQGGVESDDLLSRIGGFAADVEAGRWADWDEGWGGYESRWDEDSEDWADELVWLLDSISARFTARDYADAALAYGRLLGVVAAGEDEGNLPPLHVASRDIDWAEISARWLRCIYEANTDLADRVAQMADAVAVVGSIAGPPTLQAVLDAHRPEPKDVAGFLPAWISELDSRLPWGDSPAGSRWESRPLWALLVEATIRHDGPAGVLGLARRSGPHQPDGYQAAVEARLAAGDKAGAEAVGREAISVLAHGEDRAVIAEHLITLRTDEGDVDGALDAALVAWESALTIRRLVTVVAAGRRASQEPRALDSLVTPASLVAARRSRRGLDAIALIVRGDLTSATALLPDTGDWADQSSLGLVVVPVLLAAASGASGHPAWPKSQLAGLLAELDRWDHLYEPTDAAVPPADGLTIAGLLAHAAADAGSSASPKTRASWLRRAAAVIDHRVEHLVTTTQRKLYHQAASLVVGLAEATLHVEGQRAAGELAAQALARFPRHVAYRDELLKAQRSSPLLPDPPRRRR